jgi:hypothetical protein
MRKQVTQAELRECLDLETLVNRRMMQIRKRLQQGATVEPGELGARADRSNDNDPEVDNYNNMGLQIANAEEMQRYDHWPEAERGYGGPKVVA